MFDKISGLTQEEAFATDARTQNEVSQAMDILMRTGDYSPLTGDKRMLNDMQAKGLSPKEYAFFLKNKYDGKQAQAQVFRRDIVNRAIKEAEAEQTPESQSIESKTPSNPPTPSAAAASFEKLSDPPSEQQAAVRKGLPGGAGKRGGGDIYLS